MTEEERRKLAEVRNPFRGEHPNKDLIAAFCREHGITGKMLVKAMTKDSDKTPGLSQRNSEERQ